MRSIDLNCDLGEGSGCDEQLMPLITSANIACGGHAGDEQTMRHSVQLAKAHGVNIGAHPGFPDRAHFGRREMSLPPDELRRIISDQIHLLRDIAASEGTILRHVKPHGALYNTAARDSVIARAIVNAVADVDPSLSLVGLANSRMIDVAEELNLKVIPEFFADRTYQPDGTLTPRSRADAVISDPDSALVQVLRMIRDNQVAATNGRIIAVKGDTVCVHGDGQSALRMLSHLRSGLESAGVIIRGF